MGFQAAEIGKVTTFSGRKEFLTGDLEARPAYQGRVLGFAWIAASRLFRRSAISGRCSITLAAW